MFLGNSRLAVYVLNMFLIRSHCVSHCVSHLSVLKTHYLFDLRSCSVVEIGDS